MLKKKEIKEEKQLLIPQKYKKSWEYYEQLYAKLGRLGEMDKFLQTACQNWVKEKQIIWTDWSLEVK